MTIIMVLAYLATLVFIWRGWGILGRIGCYIAFHLLLVPGWIFVIAFNLAREQQSGTNWPGLVYLIAVMVAFSVGSILMRGRTLERQARYREAVREASERLGYDAPPYAGGSGRVITDPPPPAGPPHEAGGPPPRSPDGRD